MKKVITPMLMLAITSGCSSLSPKMNELTKSAPQTSECKKLNSDYSTWGATAKTLAVLAGAATPVETGVVVGAIAAGVSFYADTRAELYVQQCTTQKT